MLTKGGWTMGWFSWTIEAQCRPMEVGPWVGLSGPYEAQSTQRREVGPWVGLI